MASSVAIIDYGSGNLRSAAKALERAAAETGREVRVLVTGAAERVAKADALVLPGVGAFADCWRGLEALDGVVEALQEAVLGKGRPFLGICVGMQLLATRGLEHGSHPGLDWIAGEVVALEQDDPSLKVPHMGWNELRILADGHPVLAGLGDGDHAYFVHSYRFEPERREVVLAEVDYGGPLVAAIGRDTMIATQFHPEKSQAAGLRLLANFLAWRPQ